jgi:hypothetical protein
MRTVLVRVQPPQPNLLTPDSAATFQIIPNDSAAKGNPKAGITSGLCIHFVKTILLGFHEGLHVLPPIGMVHWVWFFGVGGGSRSEGRSCRPSPQSPKGILGASSLLRFLLFARGTPNTKR